MNTPPHDPANPGLEQELCRILGYDFEFLSDMSIQEDEVDQLKTLITQREAQAYKQAASDIFNLAHKYAQEDKTMVGAEELRAYHYYNAIAKIGEFDGR